MLLLFEAVRWVWERYRNGLQSRTRTATSAVALAGAGRGGEVAFERSLAAYVARRFKSPKKKKKKNSSNQIFLPTRSG